jgi:long-chain acyl-CoA synthetase
VKPDRQRVLDELTAPGGRYPVARREIRGVGLLVYENAPGDVRSFLAPAAERSGGLAVAYEHETYSWPDYLDAVLRLARALREEFRVAPGDRVGIAMRNYPEWFIAFGASVTIGAIAVPLNAWLLGAELAYALDDCSACVVICDSERASRIAAERAGLPGLRAVIVVRPDETSTADADYSAVLADQQAGIGLFEVPIGADDDCTIMYTSGTTGRPKGAVATHRAHVANLMNAVVGAEIEAQLALQSGREATPGEPPEPVHLITGPLFHIAGLPSALLNPFTETSTVLMYKWDPLVALELIERHRVTGTHGVPTVIRQLLDAMDTSSRDLSSLRQIRTGGAQASSQLIRRIGRQLHGTLQTGTSYGMTETTGPMVVIGSADMYERPLAVGVPYPTSEVRIVDELGNDAEPGESGEAVFKGPNVARGYWNRESEAFLSDGWFRSGDLVREDDDGFVSIVDRLKDIIIRAGENVYCSEVEDVLVTHPAVIEVAVYGVQHDLWGEEVAAALQVAPGVSVNEANLRTYAQERLAAFKLPTRWTLQSQPLPRNAAGKVLKRQLRLAAGAREVSADEQIGRR